METVHPGWGCGCVRVGVLGGGGSRQEDCKSKREKGKEREIETAAKGSREKDRRRVRGCTAKSREHVCVGTVSGWGRGTGSLHLRAPGEGVSWLVHLEAARPESWLFRVPLT